MFAQEIALKLGVAPRTLLDYEAAGVVTPRRDNYDRRVYTDADLAAIHDYMATRKMHRQRREVPRTLNRTTRQV